MDSPSIRTELDITFEEALERVPKALAAQGFGVLTEIDVKQVLKTKLDANFRRYKILGACNPNFALRALNSDLDIGVLLPCSVAVYEADDGKVVVAAVDPVAAIGAFGGPPLQALAQDVRRHLQEAVGSLSDRRSAGSSERGVSPRPGQ